MIRHAHVPSRPRTTRRGLAIDSTIILGGALLAIVVAQFSAPGGLVGSTGSPPPVETGIVIGGDSQAPDVTLPPLTTLGPVVNPSAGLGASPTPVPFRTLPPPTPTPAASPTPHPTPATATLRVYVQVLPGGTASSASWTVTVTGASPSPATFKGSSSGVKVRILAGVSYNVTTKTSVTGYAQTTAGDCAGKAGAGLVVNCTFTETYTATPPPSPTASLALPWLVLGIRRRRSALRREYRDAAAGRASS